MSRSTPVWPSHKQLGRSMSSQVGPHVKQGRSHAQLGRSMSSQVGPHVKQGRSHAQLGRSSVAIKLGSPSQGRFLGLQHPIYPLSLVHFLGYLLHSKNAFLNVSSGIAYLCLELNVSFVLFRQAYHFLCVCYYTSCSKI